MDDPFYPLVIAKEQFSLKKAQNDDVTYVDLALNDLSKRIYELDAYRSQLPVTKIKWQEVSWQKLFFNNNLFSWEGSLGRYEQQADELIAWIKERESGNNEMVDKIKINEQLIQHKIRLRSIIDGSNKTSEEKKYLDEKVDILFNRLFSRLNLQLYDYTTSTYTLPLNSQAGDYQIFIKGDPSIRQTASTMTISVEGKTIKPKNINKQTNTIEFNQVTLHKGNEIPLSLHYLPTNLVDGSGWINSNVIQQGQETALNMPNVVADKTIGLQRQIRNVQPNTQYLVTFDYKIQGNNALSSFIDRFPRSDSDQSLNTNVLFTELLDSKQWKTHQSLVTTDPNVINAYLQFSNEQSSLETKSDIQI